MEETKGRYLTPIKAASVVDTVVSRITNAIMNGELKPGTQIPTETELANAFGVGRNTIREAIRILVAYGILEIRRADGTYVCDGFSPKVLDPMLYGIILQKESAYKELVGLRKLIDNGILQLLYETGISEDEWKKLYAKHKDLVDCFAQGEKDPQKIAEKDIAFHHELALATHNIAVVTTYDTIVQITKDFLLKTIEDILKDSPEHIIKSHSDILEKLAGDDPEALYKTIERSYCFWFDTLGKYGNEK